MKQIFDSPIKILGAVVLVTEGILTLLLTTGNPSEQQKLWITIGMISALILTIIAAIIFHWLDNRKISSGSSIDSNEKKYEYDIFISFPIAGIEDATKRAEMNTIANELEKQLKNIGYTKIFNASLHFSSKHEHQPPKIAAKTDFDALDKSKNFLLLYPEKIPTSALIELGYALATNKNIIMCSENIHTLPFLARGFNENYKNVSFVEHETNQHLITMLTQNHQTYFVK